MRELTPREIQARFAALVGDLDLDKQGDPTQRWGRPAILLSRLTHDSEGRAGSRARLLLGTFNEHQQPASRGWRTDLRILSDTLAPAGEDGQATVLVIDEAAFYSDDHSSAVMVHRSELWVEELVRIPPDSVDLDGPGAWLSEGLEVPHDPRVEPLHRVARRPRLIGSRLARDLGGGRFQPDLRAVSPARLTNDGDMVVAVIHEQAWYRWNAFGKALTPSGPWHVPIDELWVE